MDVAEEDGMQPPEADTSNKGYEPITLSGLSCPTFKTDNYLIALSPWT
jgi:hypothetical protein